MAGSEHSPREPILTNRRIAALVIIAIVLAFLALFVADNFVLVEIRLVNLHIRARLAWAVLLPFAFGAVAGYLAGRFHR